MDKIVELEKKVKDLVVVVNNKKFNVSEFIGFCGLLGIDGFVGLKGEDGVDGNLGKLGLGNMMLCCYVSEESVLFIVGMLVGENVVVIEEFGERIIGVICLIFGMLEYNLSSGFNDVKNRYY